MLSCPKTTWIFQGFYSYHIVSANVFNLLLLFDFNPRLESSLVPGWELVGTEG